MPAVYSPARFPVPSDVELQCHHSSSYIWENLYFSLGFSAGFMTEAIRCSSKNKGFQFDHVKQRWFPRQVSAQFCYDCDFPFKLHQLKIVTKAKFNPSLSTITIDNQTNNTYYRRFHKQLPLAIFEKEGDTLSYDFHQGLTFSLKHFNAVICAEWEEAANMMFIINGYLFNT